MNNIPKECSWFINNEFQQAFLCDNAKYVLALGGLGAGKTILVTFQIIRYMLRYPGIKATICAPTYPMLRRGAIEKFMEICNWDWGQDLIEEYNKSENVVKFKNGSLCYFMHADQDRIRGSEISTFALDEAAMVTYDTFRMLQTRCRQPGFPHRGFLATTPRGKNFLYDIFYNTEDDNYSFHKWSTFENPSLTDEDMQVWKDSYIEGSDLYNQELMAEWVDFAGLVYHITDDNKLTNFKMIEVSNDRLGEFVYLSDINKVFAGIDWGTTSIGSIVVGGEDKDGNVYILDEEAHKGKLLDDWIVIAINLQRKWGIDKFYADPEDANAILTFNRKNLVTIKANNKRMPGVRQVQSVLPNMKIIESNCPNLMNEFYQYSWKEDSDGNAIEDQDPQKVNDHSMDALRYLIMGIKNVARVSLGKKPKGM